MTLTRLFTLVAVVGIAVCTSCQSSKIAYGNSYYFKATPRPTPQVPDLYASTAPTPVASKSISQRSFSTTIPSPPLLAPQPKKHQPEQQATTRREVRQERRAHRKAMRTQLKQWLKEAPADVKKQAKQQVDGFSRIGIIVGAAGLVMLLVGLIAGGNAFLVALGGILLGIGVVFILIDVL